MKKKIFIIVFSVIAAAFGAFALTGCKKAQELFYKAPENIEYDGQYITWGKVENAKHYTVSVDGGEAARCNSTTYAYASYETFEVTVTAVFDKTEKSASVSFKPLEKIETLTVSNDGEVSWDAVAGANAYSVSVNGTAVNVTDTRYSELPEGSNRVKVKPIVSGDNTFYSSYSGEVNVYIYGAPTGIKYDGTTLTWTGSSSEYEITLNGETKSVTGNKYDFNSGNRDFTVGLKSIGNHTNTYDSKTASEEFKYLDPVTDLKVEDGILKWTTINDAEGYKVKIGGVVQKKTVEESEYADLDTGRSLDVAVMPFNESGNYFSSWSAEKSVYILETPTVKWSGSLELDGEENNNIVWDAVSAAAGYKARLVKDGGTPYITEYSDTQRSYANEYANVGIYTVEIQASADPSSNDYYSSRFSKPIKIERLAGPRAANSDFIVSNKDSLAAGFTVNFVQVNGASGYQLYKDDVKLSGKYTTASALTDNNIANDAGIEGQEITYRIKSEGSVRNTGDGTYVRLGCLTKDALEFGITVQATPQNPTMSGFTLSWDAVTGSDGYCVSYAGSSLTANRESADLSTVKAGEYKVSVCARGNGGATLASNFSAPVTVTRLDTPKNIKITATDNGTLEWTRVANATAYEAYLGTSTAPLNENALSNMYQYIGTEGTTVSMVAVANKYNDDRTVYYMTSEVTTTEQFIRLAAPAFPEGALSNSNELVWSAPSNINTNVYTPTYKIFSAIGEQIGGGVHNETKYNISNLDGGKSYTFYVKAIGNDVKYLDSDYSVVITAYKIATPTISIENNNYVWSSMPNATSYYLEIDGRKASDDYHVSGSTYTYTPRFTTEGAHTVKLKAVGDGRGNLDSKEYVLNQVAKQLKKPTITYGYSSEAFVDGGSIYVNVTADIPNNNGYLYEIAGQSSTSNALTFSKVIESPSKYSVSVKALGGKFDASGVYYVDSLTAGGEYEGSITLLGAPAQTTFTLNSDGNMQWRSVTGCSGYEYTLSFNGEAAGEIKTTGQSTLNIQNHKQYSSITVKVRAKGNGNNVVSSAWTTWTWTNSNSV